MSRILRAGITIPLLCVALLITSCTLDRGFFSLIAHASDQGVIIVQGTPTSIPAAQIGGTTQRIRFAAGATSAQVSGQTNGTSIDTYLLEARAGQQMRALVSSPYSNVYLTVVSPGGSPLARAQAGAQNFNGNLPETGDYTLQISAPVGTATTTYILNVSVTGGAVPTTPPGQPGNQRIRFATGATSASVNGEVDGNTYQGYLLEAQAGQLMRVNLISSGSPVYLTVVSPGGSPLARAQAGAQSFYGTLPESGDYTLQVSAPAGTPTTYYTLIVSATNGASSGFNQRIRFAAGATSATVTGQDAGSTVDTYLLNAFIGQTMQVTLASPSGTAYLNVIAPDGSPLARAQAGAQSFSGSLPVSGDYQLQVMLLGSTAQTSYTLTVSVTGNGGLPSGPITRITFPAGGTSATVNGSISGPNFANYLLAANAGQYMNITVASPSGQAYLTVVSPGGSPLARAQAGAQAFSGQLPETGDYRLTVSNPSANVNTTFTLTVTVTGSASSGGTTQRITFPSGATGTTVSGQLDAPNMLNYLLEASAGQYMQVSVTSPAGSAYLTVVSPGGSPLARAQAGAQAFNGTLPESGDYRLTVSSPDGTAHTPFTLSISVTGSASSGGTTQRIHFPAGGTGASVSGNVGGSAVDTYLLEAGAGQYMQVSLASPTGQAYLNVITPDGSPLARAQAGAQAFSGNLPTSGDYQLQVMTLGGAPATSYTLTVSVTG